MNLKEKLGIPMLLLLILTIIGGIAMLLWLSVGEVDDPGTVPLFGIPNRAHMALTFFLIPMISSMVTALIFSRILTPFFLRVKGLVYRRYKDAIIEFEPRIFSMKIFFKRGIYIFMLTIGIMGFIIPTMSDDVARLFINVNTVDSYKSEGLRLAVVLPVFMSLSGLLLPIVIGLWSVSWFMEDSGVIHYAGLAGQEDRKDKLFEIEPVHLRYSSYLKGYAGISAIIFLFTLIVYFSGFEGRESDVIMLMLVPMFNIFMAIPAYVVYGLTLEKYTGLKKRLPSANRIAVNQLVNNKE